MNTLLASSTQTTAAALERIRRAIRIEARELELLADRVDENAAAAVELLLHCPGRVIVVGMGKSGLIGRKIAATLCSTGTPAFFLHPAEAFHGDLGIVGSDDVLLALSSSGETVEILDLLPQVRRLGVSVITLTGKPTSTLARRSDLVINVAVEQEADPLGVAPMASTTAMLAMGDALAAALVEQRGFTREQFAIFHPGGHLGRKLLLRVADLMHVGDAVPRVRANVTLRDAICEMSDKRLGAIFVVSDSGTLAGIFTDGDLRRLLEKSPNPLETLVTEAMHRQPHVITPDRLAAEALQLMEQRAITVLPVVDAGGAPCGAIHLHDLVKAGLA